MELYISLTCKNLKSLPSINIPYSEIKGLDLSYNSFTAIPEEVFKMTNLEHLCLTCNKINKLPSDIGKLTKLKYLSLMTNNISKIPNEILELKNLKSLYLGFNPITIMPYNFDKTKYKIYTFGIEIYNNPNLKNIEETSEDDTIDSNDLPSYDEINLSNNAIYLSPPKYDDI